MVLATEMTKHFEHVNKFVNSVNKPLAALEVNEVRVRLGLSPHAVSSLNLILLLKFLKVPELGRRKN